MAANGSGIAEGGVYLHNSPSEAQKFNVVQLLISGTSAPTFGNTLLAVRAGLLKRNFEYKEFNTTKVRIKPYRNGFRFEITFANGKKPNHVYNTRAAAKKGLKDLAEALTNYEIVK